MLLTILAIFFFVALWVLAFAGLADALKAVSGHFQKPPKPQSTPLRPYCLGPRV